MSQKRRLGFRRFTASFSLKNSSSEARHFFFIGLAVGFFDARRRRAFKNGGVKKKCLASALAKKKPVVLT